MRILLLGPNSYWTQSFAENVLFANDHDVTAILAKHAPWPWPPKWRNGQRDCYYVSETPEPKERVARMLRRVPGVRGYAIPHRLARRTRSLGNPDAIHVHYASFDRLWAATRLRVGNEPLIVTFWGGDVQRTTKSELQRALPLLRQASAITYSSQAQLDALHARVGDVLDAKLVQRHFGVDTFQAIDRVNARESRGFLRERWAIPADSVVVTVGYNGFAGQQHLAILQAITQSKWSEGQGFVVIPAGYGARPGYTDSLRQFMADHSLSGLVLEGWQAEPEEVARLRLVSDVFIHGQVTDALSSSVQEYAYAGNIMVNGSWLHYPELIERGVEFESFDSFAELPGVLDAVQSGVNMAAREGRRLRVVGLASLSSGATWAPQWANLYKAQKH